MDNADVPLPSLMEIENVWVNHCRGGRWSEQELRERFRGTIVRHLEFHSHPRAQAFSETSPVEKQG